MGKLFGTDGVRGIANTQLTGELAFNLGRAGAYVLTKATKHSPRILVATDTRMSSDMLEAALVAGITSVGAQAVVAGVIPTPAVAYLVRKYHLDAGVMISASHNPMEYNGIKFFDCEGYKLSDLLEEEIEEILLSPTQILPQPTGVSLGRKMPAEDAVDDYIAYLETTTKDRFEGIKVALDCANGASYKVAPITLLNLGASLCIIHNEPNGSNINDKCGSTHMGDLSRLVVENGADIGFAFDGDADRCLAVDENGDLIDGDKILAICAIDMKKRRLLKKNTIVATVMSNLGLSLCSKENDLELIQTGVGDRYVLEEMLKNDYNLGGEQSGHVIFLDHNTTGDGVLTAIELLSVLKRSGKKASELAKTMIVLPQVLVNARVDNSKKNDYMKSEKIKSAIKDLEERFKGDGRVLIRTSGTEPLVRVMIEGKDLERMDSEAKALAKLIEEELN